MIVVMTGCSSVRPESSDPRQHLAHAGELTLQAQSWTCERIVKQLDELLEKMKSLQARANKEKQEPPATLANAYGRIFGPEGAGIVAIDEYRRERTYADQLNAALAGKGCATLDLHAKQNSSAK